MIKIVAVVSIVLFGNSLNGSGETTPKKSEFSLDHELSAAIFTPENPSAVEKFAAEELQTYLQKITGRKLEITTNSETEVDRKFIIGKPAADKGIESKELSPDEFIVSIEPSTVRIIGGKQDITLVDESVVSHERGILYGVYEVLEKLGVRWYRPGPLGEHVPRSSGIFLPVGEQKYSPAYQYRFGIKGYYSGGEKISKEDLEASRIWSVRSRQNAAIKAPSKYGGDYDLAGSHSYAYLLPPKKYFDAHPEYYALMNGKRIANGQLCLSNADVQDLVTEAVILGAKNRPQRMAISLDPNDGQLWCECEGCKKMDDPNLMSVKGAVTSMSNRVCAFNNLIAKRLKDHAPGYDISWLAYNHHTEVPTIVDYLEDNTLVWAAPYAGAYSDWGKKLEDPTSKPNKRFLEILEGYSKLTKLFVYEYFGGYYWEGPMPIVSMIQDRLKVYRKFGVDGVYTQGNYHWGPQALPYYMAAKLMWNPDMDVQSELDLYYTNYYGPAAVPMKKYHELLEEAANSEKAPYFGSGGNRLEDLFTDELLDRAIASMDEARDLVKGKEPYAERLEGVWAGLEHARMTREMLNYKSQNNPEAALKVLREMEDFVASYPLHKVFEPIRTMQKVYGKELYKMGAVIKSIKNSKVLQDCNRRWDFKTDPLNRGIDENWMSASFDSSDWAKINADQWWQRQGYKEYNGVAWYRRSIENPAIKKGKRVILYFGSVDGDATVYVNGTKVGEHNLTDEGEGWNEAFYFDITDYIADGGKTELAVRVDKKLGMGGIFGGVQLMQADAQNN